MTHWLALVALGLSLGGNGSVQPPVTALAVSPDGTTLVAGSQAGILLYAWPDLDDAERLASFLEHVHQLAFAPDGRQLLAAGGSPGEEGLIEVYDWPSRQLLHRISGHDDVVYGADWRDDSMVLATASLDGTVGLFQLPGGERIGTLRGHSRGVTAVRFLSAQLLVSASRDESLRVWDLEQQQVVRTLSNHTRPVHALAVRPAGGGDPSTAALPMIASTSDDRTIRFWQPTIGRMVRFRRLEQATPLAACWSPDGRYLMVACSDGQVRWIDPDTTRVTASHPMIDGIAYALTVHPAVAQLIVGGQHGRLARRTLQPGD